MITAKQARNNVETIHDSFSENSNALIETIFSRIEDYSKEGKTSITFGVPDFQGAKKYFENLGYTVYMGIDNHTIIISW